MKKKMHFRTKFSLNTFVKWEKDLHKMESKIYEKESRLLDFKDQTLSSTKNKEKDRIEKVIEDIKLKLGEHKKKYTDIEKTEYQIILGLKNLGIEQLVVFYEQNIKDVPTPNPYFDAYFLGTGHGDGEPYSGTNRVTTTVLYFEIQTFDKIEYKTISNHLKAFNFKHYMFEKRKTRDLNSDIDILRIVCSLFEPVYKEWHRIFPR